MYTPADTIVEETMSASFLDNEDESQRLLAFLDLTTDANDTPMLVYKVTGEYSTRVERIGQWVADRFYHKSNGQGVQVLLETIYIPSVLTRFLFVDERRQIVRCLDVSIKTDIVAAYEKPWYWWEDDDEGATTHSKPLWGASSFEFQRLVAFLDGTTDTDDDTPMLEFKVIGEYSMRLERVGQWVADRFHSKYDKQGLRVLVEKIYMPSVLTRFLFVDERRKIVRCLNVDGVFDRVEAYEKPWYWWEEDYEGAMEYSKPLWDTYTPSPAVVANHVGTVNPLPASEQQQPEPSDEGDDGSATSERESYMESMANQMYKENESAPVLATIGESESWKLPLKIIEKALIPYEQIRKIKYDATVASEDWDGHLRQEGSDDEGVETRRVFDEAK